MVLDTLSHFSLYLPLHRLFPVVSEFIHSRELRSLEAGKHPIGNGITVIIDEYDTRPPHNRFLEVHRQYIDIQILLAGMETIGIAPASNCATTTPYNPDRDFELLSGPMDFVTLHQNDIAVFFPHDAHMPGTTPGTTPVRVRKMVVKVPVKP